MSEYVYVLHDQGAPSHYQGLEEILNNQNKKLVFREFNILRKLAKSLRYLDARLFYKQLINLAFLFTLIFTKRKTIVLGIAPFDLKLIVLGILLKKHDVYYHTSHPNWAENANFPHKRFISFEYLRSYWKSFLREKVKHIFTVTNSAKKSLIENNYSRSENISVVFHSFTHSDFFSISTAKSSEEIKFIFTGRLIPSKGVNLLLNFFSENPRAHLTIIGDGELKELVIEFANKYDNITYLGYIGSKKELAEQYRAHHYLALPSIKQPYWEELFGMVIIEAMACGVVPICTNHAGPKEIISEGIDGFLVDEENYEQKLNEVIESHTNLTFLEKSEHAISTSSRYTTENISKLWEKISIKS